MFIFIFGEYDVLGILVVMLVDCTKGRCDQCEDGGRCLRIYWIDLFLFCIR